MNLPNKLSILRILIVPFMVFFYLAPWFSYGKIIALALFIIAALTDMFDGYLARKNNQVTTLGKLLDPIADKVLAISIILLIIVDGTIPAPFGVLAAIIIVSRDLAVDALRQIAATKNNVVAADFWGKIKTICFDIAFPLLILFSFLSINLSLAGGFVYIIMVVGYSLFAIGTVLCAISGINYFVKNKEVFLDK